MTGDLVLGWVPRHLRGGQALLGPQLPHISISGCPTCLVAFSHLQDAAYHCVASLFYFGASVLEALAAIELQVGFTYKHYHENIAAVVSPQSICPVHSSH